MGDEVALMMNRAILSIVWNIDLKLVLGPSGVAITA